MYWNSFAEFLAMGHHGVYVWGAVGVMALAMIVEPLLLVRGQKTLITRLQRQFRAESGDRSSDRSGDQSADRPRNSEGKH
jgi:heme exporter protein D